MTTLPKCQENIATHSNCDMGSYAVKIKQLRLSFQIWVVLFYFEEHLNILPFIDTDNLMVLEVNPAGQYRKPLKFFVVIANEYNFNLMRCCSLCHYASEILGFTLSFCQHAVQLGQFYPLGITAIKDVGNIFGHANYWQILTQYAHKSEKGKQFVYQDIIGPDSKSQYFTDYCFHMNCRFGKCFNQFFTATVTFVQLFIKDLNTVASFSQRTKPKDQQQEIVSTVPAPPCLFELLQAANTIVVMYSCQQFNNLGDGAVVGGVDKDQKILSFIISQYEYKTNKSGYKSR